MHGDPVRYPSDRTTRIDSLCPECGRASKRVATLRGHVDNREYEIFRCLACGFVLSSKVKGPTFWSELRDRDTGEAYPEAEVRMGLKPENIHLLSDLHGRLSTDLFADAKLVRLAAGNTLFLAGDSDDDCYRIEDGLLKVTMVSHSGDERILAFVGRGDIVGELSIIDGLPRSASVVAVRDATLSCLSRTAFEIFAKKIRSSTNRWSSFSLNACAKQTRWLQLVASFRSKAGSPARCSSWRNISGRNSGRAGSPSVTRSARTTSRPWPALHARP